MSEASTRAAANATATPRAEPPTRDETDTRSGSCTRYREKEIDPSQTTGRQEHRFRTAGQTMARKQVDAAPATPKDRATASASGVTWPKARLHHSASRSMTVVAPTAAQTGPEARRP